MSCTPIHLYQEDERIQQVDYLTKVKDTDNWSIDYFSFKALDDDFKFKVDLLADSKNKKTECFISKYYNPSSSVEVHSLETEWHGSIHQLLW